MCHSSLSSHGPFISPAPFNVRPVSALHDLPLSSLLRRPGDALYRATRCGVIFFIAAYFTKVNFLLTLIFTFVKYLHGRRGRPGTRPHGTKYQSRNRQTYRLSGREAPSNRGVGAEEAPPQARTKLTRAGRQRTAGETAADRPQRDGGRIKQGDERCGRGWVFSESHNKTGSIKLVQISHRRAAMGGGDGG